MPYKGQLLCCPHSTSKHLPLGFLNWSQASSLLRVSGLSIGCPSLVSRLPRRKRPKGIYNLKIVASDPDMVLDVKMTLYEQTSYKMTSATNS